MLLHLSIKNLAIVDQLALSFTAGMNVMTGETGAGKSVLLDALNLTLGDRASANIVRSPHKQAEISAAFDVTNLQPVHTWLQNQDLAADNECIVRRIIAVDGPSKAYINGHMVTLGQLKTLGEMLVNMHGQHQHHALLHSGYQQELLDQYAGHSELCDAVKTAFQKLAALQDEQKKLLADQSGQEKLQLLNYQLTEIEELALTPQELATIDQEHKKLSKAEELLTTANSILLEINGDSGREILTILHEAIAKLKKLLTFAAELADPILLLEQAELPLTEAALTLKNFLDKLNVDPAKLAAVEQRLSDIYTLARKHNIVPDFILTHYNILSQQRDEIANKNLKLASIASAIEQAQQQYLAAAKKLSTSRAVVAKALSRAIEQQLPALAMQHAKFKIEVSQNLAKPSLHGIDNIAFLVSPNPGQALQPMHKIASGGELSRFSLAMQVILTKKVQASTLVFDEVDVGVSGATAETVGKLLRELATKAQVLCVTHLPQVAAQGHTHFKVSKKQTATATNTIIERVDGKARIEELARLLGGATITAPALQNAKTMLQAV